MMYSLNDRDFFQRLILGRRAIQVPGITLEGETSSFSATYGSCLAPTWPSTT